MLITFLAVQRFNPFASASIACYSFVKRLTSKLTTNRTTRQHVHQKTRLLLSGSYFIINKQYTQISHFLRFSCCPRVVRSIWTILFICFARHVIHMMTRWVLFRAYKCELASSQSNIGRNRTFRRTDAYIILEPDSRLKRFSRIAARSERKSRVKSIRRGTPFSR